MNPKFKIGDKVKFNKRWIEVFKIKDNKSKKVKFFYLSNHPRKEYFYELEDGQRIGESDLEKE